MLLDHRRWPSSRIHDSRHRPPVVNRTVGTNACEPDAMPFDQFPVTCGRGRRNAMASCQEFPAKGQIRMHITVGPRAAEQEIHRRFGFTESTGSSLNAAGSANGNPVSACNSLANA